MQKPDNHSNNSLVSLPLECLGKLENYEFLGTRCVVNGLVYLGITEFEERLARICELRGIKGATHYYREF